MKAKRSGREQDWKTYKKLKKRCQEECRSAYNTYIAEMIAPDMDSLPRNSGPSLNQVHRQMWLAPLKDEDGLTYSKSAAKAEILNKQFSSVFICDNLSHNLPDKGPSPHNPMGKITVTMNRVYKLLAGIKIHKATGPDGIAGRLLKELASELASIFTIMYQGSFDQGQVLLDWKMAFVTRFKKGNSVEVFHWSRSTLLLYIEPN